MGYRVVAAAVVAGTEPPLSPAMFIAAGRGHRQEASAPAPDGRVFIAVCRETAEDRGLMGEPAPPCLTAEARGAGPGPLTVRIGCPRWGLMGGACSPHAVTS